MIITGRDTRDPAPTMEMIIAIMAAVTTMDTITGTGIMTGEHMIIEIIAHIIIITGTGGYIIQEYTASSVPGHLETVLQ
jgi:hypothetical protein